MSDEEKVKKVTRGRPKGSSREIEYPSIDIAKAISLIKKAFEKGSNRSLTFEEISKYMSVQGGTRSRYLGALKYYGLVSKDDLGWSITPLGIRVAGDDKKAINECFFVIGIHKKIFETFIDKNPSKDSLVSFLKKEGLKTISETVADRYLNGIEYLKKHDVLKGALIKEETKTIIQENDIYNALRIISVFFPLEDVKDEDEATEKLIKLAEQNHWEKLLWLLKGMKGTGKLKEKAKDIKDAFEADTKIKIS